MSLKLTHSMCTLKQVKNIPFLIRIPCCLEKKSLKKSLIYSFLNNSVF